MDDGRKAGILALVFGIVSASFAVVGYCTAVLGIGAIFGFIGLGCGVVSLIFSKRTLTDVSKGKKIAGRVCGIVGVALSGLAIITGITVCALFNTFTGACSYLSSAANYY